MKQNILSRTLSLLGLLLVSALPSASAAPLVIKFATVAPEGTTWVDVLKEIGADIKTKTNGNVEFKYYPGGIAGDEPDVLRKMRVGQYHGAGFTGVGMGELVPETRILELPFFYSNADEIDYVKEKLNSEFEAKFKAKGQILLGWAEPGLVYLLSQKPIHGAADMHGVKLWAWEGDPLATALINAFRVTPVNIALQDVLMALQTGMLNAVYAPPLAAMSLQWHTKAKYVLTDSITNSTGGVLVTKKQWDRISATDQTIVREAFVKGLKKLTAATRKQNDEALAKFKQLGLKMESLSPANRQEMLTAAAQIRPQLVGKLYSADLLKKVESLLAEFRTSPKKKGSKK